MTALQKVIKTAKGLQKKNKSLAWKDAIKKAGVIYRKEQKPVKSVKAKKVIGKRRVVKKVAPKKAVAKKSASISYTKTIKSNSSIAGNVRRKSVGKLGALSNKDNRYEIFLLTDHDDFFYAGGESIREMLVIFDRAYRYKAFDRYQTELEKGEIVMVLLFDNRLYKKIRCKIVRLSARGKLYFRNCPSSGFKYQPPIR